MFFGHVETFDVETFLGIWMELQEFGFKLLNMPIMGHSPRNIENGVRILSLNGVTLPGKLEQCNYHESSH